jgi:hypothetical protein
MDQGLVTFVLCVAIGGRAAFRVWHSDSRAHQCRSGVEHLDSVFPVYTASDTRDKTSFNLAPLVVKQQKLTNKVVTCYEAGAFGFHLHRRFEELGIQNYVVQPQDWD